MTKISRSPSFPISIAAHGVAIAMLWAVRFDTPVKTAPRRVSILVLAPLKRPQTKHIPAPLPAVRAVSSPVLATPVLAPPPMLVSELPPFIMPNAPSVQAAAAAAVVSIRSTAVSPIVSAKFGDAGVSQKAVSHASVHAGGFGDVESTTPTHGSSQPLSTPRAPAQILEKPRPAYTEEARRLRIEGEVQLQVVFRASGTIDIVGVIQGLGHGLDETATQAAKTIRFVPAKQNGQFVDSKATIHITFQLAS